jgi:hypothetical protein
MTALAERQRELSRAWARVLTPAALEAGECWPWPGAKNQAGYGQINRQGHQLAHRGAWAAVNGPIPEGMVICHRCDNPPCYRPSHLFLGTHADNIADRVAKGRSFTRGAQDGRIKLTDEQVAAIRAERAAGSLLPDIAHRYGVSKTLVGLIVRGLRRAAPTNVTPKRPAVGTSTPRALPGKPRKTHCPSGHPYTGRNAAYRPNGHVWCRTCAHERKVGRRAA